MQRSARFVRRKRPAATGSPSNSSTEIRQTTTVPTSERHVEKVGPGGRRRAARRGGLSRSDARNPTTTANPWQAICRGVAGRPMIWPPRPIGCCDSPHRPYTVSGNCAAVVADLSSELLRASTCPVLCGPSWTHRPSRLLRYSPSANSASAVKNLGRGSGGICPTPVRLSTCAASVRGSPLTADGSVFRSAPCGCGVRS